MPNPLPNAIGGPNAIRGEIAARLGGRDYTLCLTLGALAELESALGAGDLMALAARFEAGRLSAREATAVIGAGLRGAGREITDGEVARLPIDGGAAGYVRLVADLLEATFGGAAETASDEEGGRRETSLPNPTQAG